MDLRHVNGLSTRRFVFRHGFRHFNYLHFPLFVSHNLIRRSTYKSFYYVSCALGVGVAQLGGYLFAVGGHDGTNYLNSVEAYDPIKDR